jgi:hypothetical protein
MSFFGALNATKVFIYQFYFVFKFLLIKKEALQQKLLRIEQTPEQTLAQVVTGGS